ncbi:beta strand repeat-containing protein [Winogradskya humida]|uniref:Repeat protein (TIGR01451 family) n=1 Tax=Winogradskya humida TaxID=113566 RepID=A0ABQ3ZF64_9ACTN|nr:DUF11 domain-containing protein [Actinoplanes humidus]GIE17172.1 hypothetical protein Ahu01nite_002740 [Actinoplanes humidus]
MVHTRLFRDDSALSQRSAIFAVVLLAVALVGPPSAAQAAPANVNTTAQGIRASLSLVGIPLGPITTTQSTWQTGQPTNTKITANVGLPGVVGTGAVSAITGPDGDGGNAAAKVDGLNVLGAGTVSADTVSTACSMTPAAVTGGTDLVNLKAAGATVNPATGLDLGVPNLLTGKTDKQSATYNTGTGRLVFTVQGLNLQLAAAGVATGNVVVAESTCSGVVKFGAVDTTARTITPGMTGTPTVAITNAGEVAAPNTVITIPAPPTGYTLGTVTTTGGGTCSTASTTLIRCTGVTVPGAGSVTVSLPVTVGANAAGAGNWQPGTGTITAVSTPFPALTDTTISVSGAGRLVTVGTPQTTSGSIVVTQMSLPAGKTAQTPITVTNGGPSDATTTVTVPLAGRPNGVSIVSAAVGSNPCTVTASTITCSSVTVPANDKIEITVKAAATTTTPVGTTWDLAGLTAGLNGYAVTGAGRLLTVSDPDVNLNNGVTITPVDAIPGGPAATVRVRVANSGITAGTNTSVTIPAPPAGYTVGNVTTSGGGSCVSNSASIYCTNVTVPPMGAVTVSVPVTLASGVTANWTTTPGAPVSAASGDSTGQASGLMVTATPQWTFSMDATGPAPRTVRPGQSTTMNVTVTNDGPSDATASVFTILAPRSTTFGTLTGTAAQRCTVTGPTALRCTVTLVADDDVVFVLPLTVAANADPTTPLDGGCVSFNGDADCADPEDEGLPSIQLKTPLGTRLNVVPVRATITPGTSGVAKLQLTSTQDESGLTVSVPTADLPAGFQLTAVSTTVTSGSCSIGANAVSCSGLVLTPNQPREVAITVAVGPGVAQGVDWTSTATKVSDGDETLTQPADLAVTGPPVIDLSATVTGPPDNTVQPGDTTQVTVVVANAGPSDAATAKVSVKAPRGTTFVAPFPAGCTQTSPTVVECTATPIVAGGQGPQWVLRLLVPDGEGTDSPLDGGCVDLDNNGVCDTTDEKIDPIVLLVPFDRQVTIDSDPAMVTPGLQDVARVTVTATRGDLTNLTVTVPLGQLPPSLSVASQTSTSGSCTRTSTAVTCSGVTVDAGQTATISLGVAATPAATEGTTWTATNVGVARGAQSVSARARLAVVAAPRFTLDVTSTPPAPIPPGGQGDLTVDIDNLGPSDVNDEDISVLAPDGGTFGPLGPPTSGICRLASPTRAVCTITLTPDDDPVILKLPIVVSPGADPGTPLGGGCVDLNNNGLCETPTPDKPLPPITLATPFDRQVDISTTPARIIPGSSGNALVLLSASPAQTNLTITIPTDTKPAQMVVGLVSSSTTGTCLPMLLVQAIRCTGVNVPANGAIITVPVTVPGNAPANLVWSTRAITATNSNGDTATGSGLLVRTGAPEYTLNATVTAPAPGTTLPGDTAVERITLTNSGPSTATDALVTLKAPPGTAFGTLTAPMSDVCTRDSATRISCSVTLGLAPATLVWDLPIVIPGNYDPTSSVTGGCIDLDGDAACGGTGDQPLADIVLATPLGRITTISATNVPLVPGRTATTTFTVAMSQARDGVRVTIPRDALPAGVTTTGITVDGGATCATSGAAYTCGDFSVGAGGSVALRVALSATGAALPGAVWAPAVTVARAGESVNRTVTAATVGAAEAPLTVTVVGPAPGTLQPGGTGDLAITVTNPGPSDARNARFVFRAPTGTTFGSLNSTAAPICVRSSATQVDCMMDVAANTNRQFTLQIRVPATADPDEPVTGGCIDTNRSATCTYPPDSPIPDITLGSPLDGALTVSTRGGTATPGLAGTGYVVVTAQRSESNLTIAVPLTELPNTFSVTSATGPTGSSCQVQAVQILCTGVSLVKGVNQAVTIVTTTASRLAAGVAWTASAITVTRGTDTVRGTGMIVTTGPPVPGVRVALTGPSAAVKLGDTTTITATVTNVGPSDATGNTATISAPSQTTFGVLSGQAAADCIPASTILLNCRFDQTVGQNARVWLLPVIVNTDADPTLPATGGCVTVNGTATCLSDITLDGEFALYQPLTKTAKITFGPEEIAPGSTGDPAVVVTETGDRDGLSLVIPLNRIPSSFTVTGATPVSSDGDNSSGSCDVGTSEVTCTDMAVSAGTITVTLDVAVSGSASDSDKWTATSVTLTDDDSTTDQLVASGVLVTTGEATDTVTTTFGEPSVNPAAPGQKTVLPITLSNPGPNDASPHVMTLKVPTGLTPGSPLPDDCSWNEGSNVVTCTRNLAVGDEYTYKIPFVVGRTVSVGTTIDGGCLDAEPANNSCADDDDQPLPAISVVASRVDLELSLKRKTTTARTGGTVLIKMPYSNNGSQTAGGIVFEIDPPTGVNLVLARVLLDASASSAAAGSALAQAAATDDELATIDCIPDELGDENAVVCDGPDAAVGATSELWLSLRITSTAKKGVHPVRVTISTTSPEGNVVNNTIEALLSIAGAVTDTPTDNSDNGGTGTDNLPKTGQNLVGLLVLSVMLMIGGMFLRVGARKRPARKS